MQTKAGFALARWQFASPTRNFRLESAQLTPFAISAHPFNSIAAQTWG